MWFLGPKIVRKILYTGFKISYIRFKFMPPEFGKHSLNRDFEKIIQTFPEKMQILSDSLPFSKENLQKAPDKGIYVFYDEHDLPIYVGRSDRIKARLREHSQLGSTNTSATFAFNLAKDLAKDIGIDTKLPRKDLEKILEFKQIYNDTKTRVSKMKIRSIGISDPIEQTLFEVYVHLELKTKNEFNNH
jgi:hypothetical protein